jgi:hypothetical protein
MQAAQHRQKLIEVLVCGAVSSVFVFHLYTTLVNECAACDAAHSKSAFALLVLGMSGANALLRAFVTLARRALSPRRA